MPAFGEMLNVFVNDLTTKKVWNILRGEKPVIPAGNWAYISVEVMNTGSESGLLFLNIIDVDTGIVLKNYSFPREPPKTIFAFYDTSMPNKNINLLVQTGHNATIDREKTFTILHEAPPTPPPPTPPGPTEYILTIKTQNGMDTYPAPGQYRYSEGSIATVYAIPQEGYELDHWNLDGQNVGKANPINISMNMNHTLEAIPTTIGQPPVAPPVTPPPEEVPPPTVEIIPGLPPLPAIIPPAPEVPSVPIAPETAGLIVLGFITVVVIIGVAVWYFTKPS